MSALDDVIRRLEAGESGRAIDQDIYHALDWCAKNEDGTCNDYHAPLLTTSLDASMTLVQHALYWPRFACYDNGRYGAHAWLIGPSGKYMSDMKVWGEGHVKPKITSGYEHAIRLYPLALCIAALKARRAGG